MALAEARLRGLWDEAGHPLQTAPSSEDRPLRGEDVVVQ